MELGGPSAMTLGTTLTPEQPAGTYSSVTFAQCKTYNGFAWHGRSGMHHLKFKIILLIMQLLIILKSRSPLVVWLA